MSDSTIIHPGKQIGHLLVIGLIGYRNRTGLWECECECGRHITKRTDALLAAINRGYATGCGKGCGMRKTTARTHRRHDNAHDGEHIDWGAFISAHHDLIDRYRRAPAERATT